MYMHSSLTKCPIFNSFQRQFYEGPELNSCGLHSYRVAISAEKMVGLRVS
jgi:hypothetical protein